MGSRPHACLTLDGERAATLAAQALLDQAATADVVACLVCQASAGTPLPLVMRAGNAGALILHCLQLLGVCRIRACGVWPQHGHSLDACPRRKSPLPSPAAAASASCSHVAHA